VDIGTRLSLITKRNQRTDGSSISPDVITIGAEGATTVIGDALVVRNNGPSNTISIAGNVNVSSGPVTTESPFTFTNTYIVNDEVPRIVYGNGIFVMTGAGKVHYSSDGTTWTLSTTATPAITGDLRGLAFGNGIFMVIAQGATSVNSKVWTSTNGNNWTPGTDAIPGMYGLTFGNGIFVGVSSRNLETSIATTPGTGTIAWTTRTVTGTTGLQACAFGAMSNGTNVFVIAGTTSVIPKRSIDNGATWQNSAGIPSQTSSIDFIGFGNDIFMATTNDGQGKLSISRDGGLTWSPSVQFGMDLRSVTYVEKKWYIGTFTNTILISNDDGVTWRKVEGPNFMRAAYGNSIFVTAGSSVQSVIKFKTTRSDGTAITSDVLTIGREGTNATIAADTLTISSKIYVPPATITSEGGLTFSTDQTTLGGTPEYPKKGQRSNQVRIQTFSLSIIDEPSYYNGKNMVSIITMASGGKSLTPGSGEVTYTTNATNGIYGSRGFLNLFTVNAGQTLLSVGQTYKIVFTVKAITTNTTIHISDINNEVLLDFGYIGLSYKTYVGYFTASTASIYFSVFSTAAFEKTIVMKHLSVELLDSQNVLDVTGTAGVTGTIKCNTIEPAAITNDQFISSTQTSGRLILGDLVGRTGNIFIGNNQSAVSGGVSDGGIYIGTSARSSLVTVNIGSDSNIINLKGKIIVNNQEYNTGAYALNVKSTSSFSQGIAQLAFLDGNWSYISCNSIGAFRGGIQGINDSSIFFASSSDRRLKKNIKPMKPMLDTIMLMKPCEHGWLTNDDTAYGFIAQEVHQLFPEMRHGVRGCADLDEPCDCETGKPIYYSLDYGRFTPYIVKALQEMKLGYDAKFQELKTEYDAKISTLEARLLALESNV